MPYYEAFEPPNLGENEELCDDCDGEGRIVTGHRFIGGHIYDTCMTCDGTGKTIKRPKCRIKGCKEKQHLLFYPPHAPTERHALDENGLCYDHSKVKNSLKDELAAADKEVETLTSKLEAAKEKLETVKKTEKDLS